MKFIADEMLGKLAKWLRVLGYDTAYCSSISDSELVKRASEEGRILLTRDTRLIQRKAVKDYVFVESDHYQQQLQQVVAELSLNTTDHVLTRCLLCNSPLDSVPKESVRGKTPPFVFRTHDDFSQCRQCGRIFWSGTHVKNVLESLRSLKTSEVADEE